MTHYFLDSSALVKRYVVETGTAWVRSITTPRTGNSVIIVHITPVEIVSGTMRRELPMLFASWLIAIPAESTKSSV